jgi:hypothetical protein
MHRSALHTGGRGCAACCEGHDDAFHPNHIIETGAQGGARANRPTHSKNASTQFGMTEPKMILVMLKKVSMLMIQQQYEKYRADKAQIHNEYLQKLLTHRRVHRSGKEDPTCRVPVNRVDHSYYIFHVTM